MVTGLVNQLHLQYFCCRVMLHMRCFRKTIPHDTHTHTCRKINNDIFNNDILAVLDHIKAGIPNPLQLEPLGLGVPKLGGKITWF